MKLLLLFPLAGMKSEMVESVAQIILSKQP